MPLCITLPGRYDSYLNTEIIITAINHGFFTELAQIALLHDIPSCQHVALVRKCQENFGSQLGFEKSRLFEIFGIWYNPLISKIRGTSRRLLFWE